MVRWVRGVGIAILAGLGLLAAVAIVARFSDGPIAIFPGGPLESGPLVREPVRDWSFARDVPEVELQLVDPPRSRTVWIVVHEGAAYVPCGFLDVPLWKQWPHEVLEDDRVVVRIEGKRYELRATRVTDEVEHRAVRARVAEKYGLGAADRTDPEAVWVFRLEPREG